MKLVIDINTLVSGSLWQGVPARLLEAVAAGNATVVMSPQLLGELALVLSRPKFRERICAQSTTPELLVRKLTKEVEIISPADLALPPELRDAKDLPVLACAVAARADAIVTGDEDLLVLRSFRGIPIMRARRCAASVLQMSKSCRFLR